MEPPSIINQQLRMIQEADNALNAGLEDLKEAVQVIASHPEDTLDGMRTLQLVLQYRLDTQDSLYRALSCEQALLEILGISVHNDASVNRERLAYALGSDEVLHTLHVLTKLIDMLLRLIKQFELKKKTSAHKIKKPGTAIDFSPAQKLVARAARHQKSFISILSRLTQSLQVIGGAPVSGAILDHISQLQGPISRFYQAIQHGMDLSGGLYQKLNKQTRYEAELSEVLNQAHDLLSAAQQHVEAPRLFVLPNTVSEARLQERTEARRLSNFFNR